MKTGFLHANAWKQLYKSYYYHGLIMQCRTEPAPIYWIGYNTTPPYIPPNYYYECDGLPPTATPPMAIYKNISGYESNSGGLLYFIIPAVTPTAYYYGGTWTYPLATYKITLEASNPVNTMQNAGIGGGNCGAYFIVLGAIAVTVRALRVWKKIGGINVLIDEYTSVLIGSLEYYHGAYGTSHRIEAIRTSLNNWSVYYNGINLANNKGINPTGARGYLITGNVASTQAMDYMRLWKDIDTA